MGASCPACPSAFASFDGKGRNCIRLDCRHGSLLARCQAHLQTTRMLRIITISLPSMRPTSIFRTASGYHPPEMIALLERASGERLEKPSDRQKMYALAGHHFLPLRAPLSARRLRVQPQRSDDGGASRAADQEHQDRLRFTSRRCGPRYGWPRLCNRRLCLGRTIFGWAAATTHPRGRDIRARFWTITTPTRELFALSRSRSSSGVQRGIILA